jgi:predicted nucleic acid-binding protein
MRVLLDINVILDSMLQRSPWHTEADAIMHAAAQGQVTCVTTPLSLATIFYVGVGTSAARVGIRKYLAACEILPIDKQTLLDADLLLGNDFEDNILIAAAVRDSLDAIVTRNVNDFSHSPICVMSPVELLQRLASAGTP